MGMGAEHGRGQSAPLYRNQLEPTALIERFNACPPHGFEVLQLPQDTPGFVAPFDLLTTAEPEVKKKIEGLPLYRFWSRLLRIQTAFVGTTVSEYALFPRQSDPAGWVMQVRQALGKRYRLSIIKDIPHSSPLLDSDANAHAEQVRAACADEGFVMLEGQALAYVPMDFASTDEYLARLSASRRKDIRRKLRKRDELTIRRVATGDDYFRDAQVLATYYALYDNVYAQSEVHFDRLSQRFFDAVLQDSTSGGIVFEYWHGATLIGYNLCFVEGGKLIDKYVGFQYPQAREFNLYFISWWVNLEFALEHGLSHYVAGWTDPQIKAYLGASFTFTQHAVYVRNPLLRSLARRFAGVFESDKQWSDRQDASTSRTGS
jgi:hypothetical protein